MRSPLDAELMVSELLGTWWGERRDNTRGADVERLVGEGLVDYAARRSSPAALALLSGIACLGTPRQASKAEDAALELMERGVRSPNWAQHLGAVTGSDCYVNSDVFGDTDEVVCFFSYDGTEPHALVLVVDYNSAGMIRDGWVTSQVTKLLELCRKPAGDDGNGFKPLDPRVARRMLEAALAETDAADNPPVSESFASYHAFIRARIRTLPPSPGPASPVGPGGSTGKRRPWRKDRRAMLAAEFLASDEAEDLSDRSSASHCADRIIDYGCDQDFGRPLRMSPVKVETFLLNWLPRKVMLSPAEQEAMPHVVLAWVRWAGRRSGQGDKEAAETLDAVFNAMGPFSRAYRDPAEFGLDSVLVARLLPDGDLEALPRRAFAFPLLHGRVGGVDLSTLNPAEPDGRRELLAAAHEAEAEEIRADPADERHLEQHLDLADRLWQGQPGSLWEAAQRFLDADQDRHVVLHVLMDAIEAAGDDRGALDAALRELGPEPDE
ncbi:MAG TPA: hypothetical protein VG268_01070 [Streptosporangiaceae bacterium]|nr:hypothetical protein [Streptosporangiaceae bacterium]